ncbi:MAG: PorV/PorQ family protein [Candidatus Eisenbacteria bacterium]|uniref:PorV/PorQ family protein n=1 Tax=Eiseniibacteriota bacterium TaxID=2212470 RepID=A0A538U226_UNCEI|nr:MAG: PorV/PorQ family protein [Candidatus Eisenbacteria bacterium]
MSGKEFWMRTFKLSAGAALAMVLVTLGTAHAGVENVGTTGGNFLSLGSGARTLSMGGATLGLGDDVGGAGWNAAALGWVNQSQATLSHAGLQNNSMQEWGAYGGRVGTSKTRWAVTGIYQGDGSFEGRDASGISTGNFSVSSMALGATVAQQFGDMVTLGAGTKMVTEKLGPVSGRGFTCDGGVMIRRGVFGFGIAAQNLFGTMNYGSASFRFPTNYGAGLAYTNAATGLRVAIDANVPYAYHPDVRAGLEWTYKGMAAFRTGYRKELGSPGDPLTGPTFGLGAGYNNMWMDYGYLLSSDGSGEHRLGLRFNFNGHSGPDRDPFDQTETPKESKRVGDPSFIGPPASKPKQH